jgi:hypothetical protein
MPLRAALFAFFVGLLGGGVCAEETISGKFRLGEARAISGHLIEIKGRQILMRDYRCPDPSTARGRDAKALMNQFLRTNITCVMVEDGGTWVGDCWANDKNVTDGMVGTGLCVGVGSRPSV